MVFTRNNDMNSPQTPVLQLSAEPFPDGAAVEVKLNSEGFFGSWYEAQVLSRQCLTRYVKYKVQYLSLLRDDGSGKPLVEDVFAKNVRYRAPHRLSTSGGGNEDEDPNFEMHALVEAYHNDGWWHGVVSGLKTPETGLYTVSFPNSREVFQFKPAHIRPQLDFVNGEWVPLQKKEALSNKETYREGDKVEVFRMRDDYGPSYFPARVEEVIHNSYYMVRYESVNARPDGNLTEIIDPLFLRPALEITPNATRFMVDSHVEVFHEGGWSPGVVSSGLSGSKNYAVTVKSKGQPMRVRFDGSDMRLRLMWNGRDWSEWGARILKEKKRKLANLSEISPSDISLTESSEVTPDAVTSRGKKLKKEAEETQELRATPDAVTSRGKKLKKEAEEAQELRATSDAVTSRGKKLKKEARELRSPVEVKATSDDDITITQLTRRKLGPSKTTGYSTPRVKRAVPKVSRSRMLLRELKEYHPKISKGKRSSKCKRNLHGWMTNNIQDKLNNNGRTSSGKQKDVNLSNEGSSYEPQPNTNGEKQIAHVGSKTNYTADLAGENTVGTSLRDRTVAHAVGSESLCLLNTQDSPSDDVAQTSEGHELGDSPPLNSSTMLEYPSGSQDKSSNPGLKILASTADHSSLSPLTSAVHVSLSALCSAGRASPLPPSKCVGEISKGHQLGESLPLNSSTTSKYLTLSQDKSSVPPKKMVSSVDQASPLPLLEKSVLIEPDTTPPSNKHSLAEHTPVMPVTSDVVLPFEKTSPVWKSLETTLDVFKHVPQTPHFVKLKSESKDKREGTAIGMMVTYANLAESTRTLSVHIDATVVEEKLACLDSLEENGFIVDPIRTRLQRVLEIKASYAESSLKLAELEAELEIKEKEKMSSLSEANALKTQLADIREEIAKLTEEIAKLNEKEKALMEKRAANLDSTAGHEHNISRLRDLVFSINRSSELALEELGRIIADPL